MRKQTLIGSKACFVVHAMYSTSKIHSNFKTEPRQLLFFAGRVGWIILMIKELVWGFAELNPIPTSSSRPQLIAH